MRYLKTFYEQNVRHDLANKFVYLKSVKLPKLKKIILNYGCKTSEIKQLASSLLALETIANQKGVLTTTKHPNLLLKIRKGNPTGCKITLRKTCMRSFFSKLTSEVFPKLKIIDKLAVKLEKSTFSYELSDAFNFTELEEHYSIFNSLPHLTITLVTNCNSREELAFILKSLKFLNQKANVTQW